ncbi:mitochondrial ribosomal subunit protein-domain-containing protein, partial [Hygrophoropsis aurantiaca]
MRAHSICRKTLSSIMTRRQVHSFARVQKSPKEAFSIDSFEDFQGDDIPAGGHTKFRQQRETMHYLRLIEHEMPKLVAFRKPFVPPDLSKTPLIIRSVDFAGEEHPLVAKRSVVVPVARLPLVDEAAIHKVKLLAGVRWSPEPPKDSGFCAADTDAAKHGFVKISCEDFPKPAMNLKWISDTIDKLITEANNRSQDSFAGLPVDTRHIEAKTRKEKKGNHVYGRGNTRPSIRDFPKEWLPKQP